MCVCVSVGVGGWVWVGLGKVMIHRLVQSGAVLQLHMYNTVTVEYVVNDLVSQVRWLKCG